MNKIKISPSILSADFTRLGEEVRALEEGGADYIHIDVMDGLFVPNITIGPFIVEAVKRATDIPLDVHLMIENPQRYIGDFAGAGSDIITVHSEATKHLHSTVQMIKRAGARAGVSLNPATAVDELDYIIGDIDLVLVMSVNPGFSGQSFIPSALDKVRVIRKMIDEKNPGVELEIDGGIKADNIKEAYEAGARVFVSGSGIFGADNYSDMMALMRANVG